jgi:hypothetical protein
MIPAPDRTDAPIVQKLLGDIEAALERSGLPDDQTAAALVEIRETLIETAKKEPVATEGGPKVIKGDYFFDLKEMGGKVIESGVKLAIVAILAGHGQIDAAHAKEAVVDCLIGMRKTVLKLDDTQKLVCVAVMDVGSRKRTKIFIEPGASAHEIEDYFRKRNQIVPKGLEQTLLSLSQGDPAVLAAARYGDRGPFYQVRF